MKNTVYVFLFVFLTLAATAQSTFQLGVNFDGQNTGAFVNVAKHTHRYSKAAGYDTLGYPTSDFELLLMDARPAAEWSNSIDDPEKYRVNVSGSYQCKFQGSGTVSSPWVASSVQNLIYDATSNTTYFELIVGGYPNANHGLVNLVFTNTRRSPKDTLNSGVTDIVVNRPGYPLTSTKVFTDEFLALSKSADFACYRYYGVQNVWDGEPVYPKKTIWAERKPVNYSVQVPVPELGVNDAWSWENIITLANILKKDMWICVLMSADSNYVIQLATMLKQQLDPTINIYVENSNEVWSGSFMAYGAYNKADAAARGITFDQNYARRTVELSNLFAQVFGANEINKRIRVVLGAQQGYSGRSDAHISYITNKYGAPKNYIYAISPSAYFGSKNPNATNPVDIAKGMTDDIKDQINNTANSAYRDNHFKRARDLQLPGGCASYEGGIGLPNQANANLGNQILANRTTEVADAIKYNYIEGWKNLGGGLACYFTLASSYNRYGCWGITDDYTKPDRNYKMQALRDIIAASTTLVEETDTQSSSVQPNPAQTELTVMQNNTPQQIYQASIYTLLGSPVLQQTTQTTSLDIRPLPSGSYILKGQTELGTITQRIVIVR
ncbi:MAG: T9SS type A sorting domain-containing protein [Candidatus Kapaibacterium sp.]